MIDQSWTPEEDEAFNEVERHSNLGKQILREMGQPYHFTQRPWIGLTDEERKDIELGIEVFGTSVEDILKEAEAKLKEKNT